MSPMLFRKSSAGTVTAVEMWISYLHCRSEIVDFSVSASSFCSPMYSRRLAKLMLIVLV